MSPRRFALFVLLLGAIATAGRAWALADEEELRFLRQLCADGLYEVAADQMESLLAGSPDHPQGPELAYLLGQCYLKLDRAEPAMDWLEAFVRASPEDPRACQALFDAAQAGVQAGRLAAAEPLLERILGDYSDCSQAEAALLLTARVKAAQGESAASRRILDRLIEQSGQEELVGRALYERSRVKDDKEAGSGRSDLEALKAMLPGNPLAGFAALEMARSDAGAGRRPQALAELTWLLDRFDAEDLLAPALETRAGIYEAQGHPDLAARDLAELGARFPARRPALLDREVRLLIAAGQGQEALARARETAEIQGETPAGLSLLALACQAAGRREEAAEAWEKVASLDPYGPAGLSALRALFALRIEGEDEAGLKGAASRLLLRLEDPDEKARLLLDLGDHQARREDRLGALASWEAMEIQTPGSRLLPEALFRRARMHAAMEQWAEAGAQYHRLLAEFGASARAPQAQAQLEALERFHEVNAARAIARLLALVNAADGGASRAFELGLILGEELKDFPRAATHFDSLAALETNPVARARILLAAGRACAREAERLRLDTRSTEARPWAERAQARLDACLPGASAQVEKEARFEGCLLALADLPMGPERLPVLDAYLGADPDSALSPRLFLMRGEIRQATQGSDREHALGLAAEDFRRAMELDGRGPWASKACLDAGQLALGQGDFQEARALFRELLLGAPARPEGIDALLGLGQALIALKSYREALEPLNRYLELTPASAKAARCLIHLGDAHYFLREWDAARSAYGRVAREFPDDLYCDDALFRLALSEEQRGDQEASAKLLAGFLDHGQERYRREAAWRLGKAAAGEGRRREARELLQRLLDLGLEGKHLAEGGLLLGSLLLEDGLGDPALAVFDTLLARVDLSEGKSQAQAGRIRALLLLNRREEALSAWQVLSATGGLDGELRAELLLALGRSASGTGDPGADRRFLEACLDEHPRSASAPWALYELALKSAGAGEPEAALGKLDTLIARYPSSPAARAGGVEAGEILWAENRFQESRRRYEWAMEHSDVPSADLLYQSALALDKTDDPEAALERLQQFLDRYPEDDRVPEAMVKLGTFLQTLGRFDRAVLAYRNAELFQDREGKARLHFWIGDCLEAMGQGEEALAAFLRVGYLYSDEGLWGVTATLRAAALYEAAGSMPQARRLYEKVLAGQGEASDFGQAAAEALQRLQSRGG